ncbi:MAG: exodeoxyribonuclease V subunit gamma [Mobilicoccus sp.]|nr:exodeoxyribonuclease V subunit gamma [Mobilicoccus sp.]
MALHVHRGIDSAELAAGLAEVLARPLPDPLAQEVVVVPAKGIERWLTQRLSHQLGASGGTVAGADGVCAGVRFLAPTTLTSVLTGRAGMPRSDDPWSPDRLTWTVLAVLDAHIHEPWLEVVARHLGHEHSGDEAELRRGRRYALARHLAGLFVDYGVQRPALLTAWSSGELTGTEGDLAWQAHLWPLVVEAVEAEAHGDGSAARDLAAPRLGVAVGAPPDERHQAVLTALASPDHPLDLPARLSMFGHTRLAATEIELLTALAQHRDVHLWLPQASPASWDTLAASVADGPIERTEDDSALQVRHPLLASLGRDSRELQRSLAPCAAIDHPPNTPPAPAESEPLLRLLQHDIATDTLPDSATRKARGRCVSVREGAAADTSIQVHACHGPTRQVEVLRDVITGLLEDDPTLEPRDILVMCPDIEAYAPLFTAVFGLGDEVRRRGLPGRPDLLHPGHRIPLRLADRSLVSTNPLFTVTLALLDLSAGRVTVSEMLDLAGRPAVARRFRFDEDALEVFGAWIEQAGIRWGLDAQHRTPFHLAKFDQFTWRLGLDRLLLGVTMAGGITEPPPDSEGGPAHADLHGVLPVDDVGSGDIDLVGRAVEFVDRVWAVIDALGAATSVTSWMQALRDGVASLTSVSTTEDWQATQLDRELGSVIDAARTDASLRLADVRRLLEYRLRGRPTRANFRTGSLTVCTMVPMRSVPHRVIALVGLDDGTFPRVESVDGDDVLARAPRTGERDRRSEDRQLLLDAVMAAGEHLVITYSGASALDGAERPPAVPVGELLDAVNGLADGVEEHASVVRRHPLQPFDPRVLMKDSPFTFDRGAFDAATAKGDTPRSSFLDGPLAAREESDVDLASVHAFFAHPARAFLRERLDVQPLREDESDLDAMPVELDGLGRWGVGDRLLRDALAGVHPDEVVRGELARGLLPPAHLGQRVVDDLVGTVRALMLAAAPVRGEAARVVDVTVELPNRRLTGSVPNVHGSHVVTVTFSSISAKARLRAWIDLLALTVAHPDTPWTAHVVARQGRRVHHRTWGPLPPELARGILADLVDVRDRGMREPVPVPPKTSLAYAEAAIRRRNNEPEQPWRSNSPQGQAAAAWQTDPWRADAFPGEHADPAYALVYGPDAPLSVLLTKPRPGEDWNGEGTRLGRYALHVWDAEISHGRRA